MILLLFVWIFFPETSRFYLQTCTDLSRKLCFGVKLHSNFLHFGNNDEKLDHLFLAIILGQNFAFQNFNSANAHFVFKFTTVSKFLQN